MGDTSVPSSPAPRNEWIPITAYIYVYIQGEFIRRNLLRYFDLHTDLEKKNTFTEKKEIYSKMFFHADPVSYKD